jgi:hypothetical protein
VTMAAPQCSCDAPFSLTDHCDVHGSRSNRDELERLRAALAREREAREKDVAFWREKAEEAGDAWVVADMELRDERCARSQLEAAVEEFFTLSRSDSPHDRMCALETLEAALRSSRGEGT